MTGYCPDCGNTLCVCDDTAAERVTAEETGTALRAVIAIAEREGIDPWPIVADTLREMGYTVTEPT